VLNPMNTAQRKLRWGLALLVLALLVPGCRKDLAEQVTPSLLNSERIAQRFGSYGVRLLEQDGPLRVACLYSQELNGEPCRTVAVTLLDQPPPEELAAVAAAIDAGASLGATLKSAGWTVVKRHHLVSEHDAGIDFARLLHWPDGSPPPKVAVLAYELWAERGAVAHRFARIAEAYDPAYLDISELGRIEPGADFSAGALEVAWPDLAATLESVLR